METIKVENVKEAIEQLYNKRADYEAENYWYSDKDFLDGKISGIDESIGILENLIVRRQRNEP